MYSQTVAIQFQFTVAVAKLIAFARSEGFVLTFGEAYRSAEQQALHVKAGRSKTMHSKHMQRLAVDFNVFKNGSLCTVDQIEPLGEYWESLSPMAVWGGRWKRLKDGPHFEFDTDKLA